MQSKATSPEEYIGQLPEDRQGAIKAVRQLILDALPKGYEEMMLWGMLSYVVPLTVYPDTYNKLPLAYVSLASQKNYMTLYILCAYADSSQEQSLREGYAKAGKKLDFGKSCLRFKSLDDILPNVIAPLIASTTVEQHIAKAKELHAK